MIRNCHLCDYLREELSTQETQLRQRPQNKISWGCTKARKKNREVRVYGVKWGDLR